MSIATEINRIKTAKQNLMTAINAKGGSLTENNKLEDFVTSVEEDIQTGSGIDYSAWSGTSFANSTWSQLPNEIKSYIRTLNKIESKAFQNCTNLTSIEIPDGVTTIGSNAFEGCGFTSFSIPSGVTSISEYMLSKCSDLSSVLIPNTVTSIGGRAFQYCSKLNSITIPDGVTSIGTYAFANSGLISITIPDGVTSIGTYAFANSRLTSITIPDGVTQVPGYMCNNCSSLTTVTIHSGVFKMYGNCFSLCSNITSFTIYAVNPPTISGGHPMWPIPTNVTIYVPAESVDAYKAADYWNSYADKIQAIPTENE